MEEVLSHYGDLKKDRRIKKGLLTRTVGKLKAVVSQGADAQIDSVDIARSHAHQFIDEIDNINIMMEHILLEHDIAFENDNEGEPVSTERLQDIEMNVAELSARESEVDKLYGEWMRTFKEYPDLTRAENTTTNAMLATKTLEAFNIIADKLTNHSTPSIRPTGMSPPKWDGQIKNFCSWKCRFEKYLQSAGIAKDEDQLMYILHTSVLPPRVTATIESCTTMRGHNGVWERLQENIPKAAVIREIIAEMEAIRPIRQKTASEMRVVLDRLTDFARRITEVGKENELQSATVIHIISRKLDPDLYYEFERWMRHDFPSEELSVTRIIEFLRAETEARESILPTKDARLTDDKWNKSSLHHVSGASFTDPCPLGCGVHHKYIDSAQFQEKQPSERRDHIMATGRCFSCFGLHKSHACQ